MIFSPLAIFFFLALFFLIVFFFIMVQINIIALAFTEIGIPAHYVFLALFATLLGSFFNIPIKRIPQEEMTQERMIRFLGVTYLVPLWKRQETIIAVNFGGAVIPSFLSLYLLIKTGLWTEAFLAISVMTIVTFLAARPVKGIGIVLPVFLPAIVAALTALIVAYQHAPVIAYISGTLGTLIGADILNLEKIGKLGAPVASIGGAGTFDGIFLNGILAVLLSAMIA